VLYAAKFREADWAPISEGPALCGRQRRIPRSRSARLVAEAQAGRLALTRTGRRRLAWACVLPVRAEDVARLYPECGLP